jgi:hypothetical protein
LSCFCLYLYLPCCHSFWQPKDNPCTRADASRGSTLFRQQAGKILLLDAYGNKLDVLNEVNSVLHPNASFHACDVVAPNAAPYTAST